MSLRCGSLVAVVASLALLPAAARAQTSSSCYGSGCLLSSTTTLGTTGTTAGVVYLVVKVVQNDRDSKAAAEGGKAAELYLRQNALQLAQDLATGSGPVVDELAAALRLSADSRDGFAELLRENRKELLALADPRRLDTSRAVQFVERMVGMMQANPRLAADLDRLAAVN